VLFCFAIGLLFGVAYGAGEGDLREAYPGKLRSVDAFLRGKVFSANCARSILAGGAFAGWLLLLQNSLLLMVHGGPIDESRDLLGYSLESSPLLGAATDNWIPSLTFMTAFGLMLPLAFLRSRIRREWLVSALLLPFAGGVAWIMGTNGSWQINLIFCVVYAASVCAPFFFGDLLAACSCLVALQFVGMLVRWSAVSDWWHTLAYTRVLPVGIGFLLVELYFAWRGRVYDDADVRPRYARNVVERQALTAEIAAARLAQVRLTPDSPPSIPGLSVAGSCIPAREVGGDFFDYYALDGHRLGVFLAEGGSRELGSAMVIALAKGYLMYTARLDLSPVEILRSLQVTVGAVLRGENASMAVLYAVIDGSDRTVRYARTGSSPQVLVNGAASAEEIVGEPVDGVEIYHGATTLGPNDALFFYTDGWSREIAERTRQKPGPFLLGLLKRLPQADASALHEEALAAVMKRRNGPPPDDVTTVVVRLEAMAAAAVGGIA
jgi:hypothetical protein